MVEELILVTRNGSERKLAVGGMSISITGRFCFFFFHILRNVNKPIAWVMGRMVKKPNLLVSKLSREPPLRPCSLWMSLLRCFCKPG